MRKLVVEKLAICQWWGWDIKSGTDGVGMDVSILELWGSVPASLPSGADKVLIRHLA